MSARVPLWVKVSMGHDRSVETLPIPHKNGVADQYPHARPSRCVVLVTMQSPRIIEVLTCAGHTALLTAHQLSLLGDIKALEGGMRLGHHTRGRRLRSCMQPARLMRMYLFCVYKHMAHARSLHRSEFSVGML